MIWSCGALMQTRRNDRKYGSACWRMVLGNEQCLLLQGFTKGLPSQLGLCWSATSCFSILTDLCVMWLLWHVGVAHAAQFCKVCVVLGQSVPPFSPRNRGLGFGGWCLSAPIFFCSIQHVPWHCDRYLFDFKNTAMLSAHGSGYWKCGGPMTACR